MPQTSALVALPFDENQSISKGQIVAELSAERYAANTSVEAEQAKLAQMKLFIGKNELSNLTNTAVKSQEAIRFQLLGLKKELAASDKEWDLINLRLTDLQQQLKRQNQLVQEGFVSQEAVELKNAELLRLQGEKSAVERQQTSLTREIDRQTQELDMIDMRLASQKSQLSRELASAQQEFNEHTSKRIQLISPIDGVVTQISAKPGQLVRPDIPLLTVIPSGDAIEIILLLPSRSIGFVREGQKVSVRYQAYPHEHYGRHYGTVREISRIALPPQEVAQHIKVEEPVYTVRVSLPADHMLFEGKKLMITPGMVVEADVELDRLKIYQWLLEPLYRLGGRV